MVKSLVLRVDGTNCEQETVRALELAGSRVLLAHINELLKKVYSLEDFQVLVIPGGFSFGDDVAAGKIIANYLKHKLKDDVKKFVDEGKPVLGICNGFQALLNSGFLDAEATLCHNDSGLFVDKWVRLRSFSESVFNKGIKELFVPVNHGEGKFVAEKKVLEKLEENNRIVFKYVDNPNGSFNDVAGIVNEEGNVFGLMPHPEKFVHHYTHPYWTRIEKFNEEGGGLKIFKNLVEDGRKHE